MHPFHSVISPALTAHYEAQFAFWNDLSTSLSESWQRIADANLQLGLAMLDGSRDMPPPDAAPGTIAGATDTATAGQQITAYRHHLAHLGADLQVALARARARHALETARSTQALADELARTVAEQRAQRLVHLAKAGRAAAGRASEQEESATAGREMHAEGHADLSNR